jgi:hypothetical protein
MTQLQVAAFGQSAAVGRGNNSAFVMAICTVCGSTERRVWIKFCFKIGKPANYTSQENLTF